MKTYKDPISITSSYTEQSSHVSLCRRFNAWCENQEEKRLLWLAIALTGHGCVITILTIFAIVFSGNHMIFWPFVMGAMVSCLIVNLAALPTKITIPVFFVSVLIDLTIIALCIANGIDLNSISQ